MATNTEIGTADLLRAAALLIESRQPHRQALLTYRTPLTREGSTVYLVQFSFPGVVTVHVHQTGKLIVQSRPGRPTEPDVPAVSLVRSRPS